MHQNIDFDGIQAQLDWLDSTLSDMSEDNEIIWKVVVTHNPIFSAGITHGDNDDLKQTLLPILEKYQVDVVLTGHDHSAQYLRMNMDSQGDHTDETQPKSISGTSGCSLAEFIPESSGSLARKPSQLSGAWESVSRQHKYMHHFVLGNGGVNLEEICPSKQQTSRGELMYGTAKIGVGDVKITETELVVELVQRNGSLLYRVRIQRENMLKSCS